MRMTAAEQKLFEDLLALAVAIGKADALLEKSDKLDKIRLYGRAAEVHWPAVRSSLDAVIREHRSPTE